MKFTEFNFHRKLHVQPTLIFLSTVIINYFFVTRWRTKIDTITTHHIFGINEELLSLLYMTNRIWRNWLKRNYFTIIASFFRLNLICVGGIGIIHYLEIDWISNIKSIRRGFACFLLWRLLRGRHFRWMWLITKSIHIILNNSLKVRTRFIYAKYFPPVRSTLAKVWSLNFINTI